MDVRALRPTDDRAAFRSGNLDFDRFFQRFAGQNQFRHHIGVTYVAVEDPAILGYTTIAPGSIATDLLPESERARLPAYPLPILRLARLAVAESARGRGVGDALVRAVLTLALELRDTYGCVGTVVDAKPDAVGFYRRLGFDAFGAFEGSSEERPAPTPMWLPIETIARALAPRSSRR